LKNKASRSKQEIKLVIGTKSIIQKAFEMVIILTYMFLFYLINLVSSLFNLSLCHFILFIFNRMKNWEVMNGQVQ